MPTTKRQVPPRVGRSRRRARLRQRILEIPLRCGASICGRLRIRPELAALSSFSPEDIRRLTTLATMAACAMEGLGLFTEWPAENTHMTETTRRASALRRRRAPRSPRSASSRDPASGRHISQRRPALRPEPGATTPRAAFDRLHRHRPAERHQTTAGQGRIRSTGSRCRADCRRN